MSEQKEKQIQHPMEEILQLETGSTTIVKAERENKELVISETYDDKDQEIEQQFEEIYNAAMSAFEQQEDEMTNVEPKYRARNQEVAVQYLSTALSAAREKANLKNHKDKTTLAQTKGPSTVNNNLVVDRNEVLKSIVGNQQNDGTTYENGQDDT